MPGGATKIGAAIVTAFRAAGAKVMVADINAEAGAALVADGVGFKETNLCSDTDSSSRAASNVDNDLSAQSGGNSFDFSNYSKNASAPGLTSFGAGSCSAGGAVASAGVPGIALGYGSSQMDDACTRRAWVQAILAMAQQMPERRDELHLLAIAVMMGDDFVLAGAQELGIFLDVNQNDVLSSELVSTMEADTTSGCIVVIPKAAPKMMDEVLRSRGCVARRI